MDSKLQQEREVNGTPFAEARGSGAGETLYPCADCGTLRTKAEGGTTFTVCDECWEKHYAKYREGKRPIRRLQRPRQMNALIANEDVPARFAARTGSASLPPVLDACCGSRMFWFDDNDARALFLDQREGEWKKDYGTAKTKGRSPIVVRPDVLADFTDIPFPDESFSLVVFDPPHHTSKHFGNGENCLIKNCYGVLLPGWEEMLAAGFAECFRVLKANGTLIFKWGSREIPLARVLALTPHKPLFGHTTGAKAHTHWVAFMKLNAPHELPPIKTL